MTIITKEDMNLIEEMAKRYDVSVAQFGKLVSSQMKTTKERQFRVSLEEDEIIVEKANSKGMTKMKYCEYACSRFLKSKNIDKSFFMKDWYGKNRIKRIAVQFSDVDMELEMLKVAEKYGIDIGTLLRYCALNF